MSARWKTPRDEAMTRRIFKYALVEPIIAVQMPRFARVIHVGAQGETPTIWVVVDDEQPSETRTFYVYGTGHALAPLPLEHRGTTQTNGGFVWHVWELPVERRLGDLLADLLIPDEAKREAGRPADEP